MLQEFTFSWSNITVTISEKHKTFWKSKVSKKTILNNVSGVARSNSLFAIIGISGSGKTTLLRAISGQCREKVGSLKINTKVISNSEIQKIAGYVAQQDIFPELLTVAEYLDFIVALKDRKQVKNKSSIIKSLLNDVNLEKQLFTTIKNLSSGEKRRLSLIAELIGDPPILFCDEPTTGLDSYSSIIIIKKLQKLTQSGKICLTTIHQPSSQLFQYFDQLILLSRGKLIYQGTKEETQRFFENLNLFCPKNYNPSDFYIRCMVQEDIRPAGNCIQNGLNPNQWENTTSLTNTSLLITKKNSFFYELKWLFWRNYLLCRRNTVDEIAKSVLLMIEFAIVSFIYSKTMLTNQENVQDIEGLLSFVGTEMIYCNMYAIIYVFPEELEIFVQEKKLYSSLAYFLSKFFYLIPPTFLTTVGNMTVLFVLVNFLDGFNLWLQMTSTLFLINVASSALGLAFSANFQSIEHVDLYLGPFELLLLLSAGFFIKINRITILFSWIKYFSPFYYSFDMLSNLLWQDVKQMNECSQNITFTCYKNGQEVLRNYGLNDNSDSVFYNILFLLILTLSFCFVGFIGIVRKRANCNI